MRHNPSRRRFFLIAAVVVVLGVVVWLSRGRAPTTSRTPSEDKLLEESPPKVAQTIRTIASASPSSSAASSVDRGARTLAQKRLDRARHTLEGYLQSTRYPSSSRPISEKPDLVEPHRVEKNTLPLALKKGQPTDAKVNLSQDRLFLVGDEFATLGMSCQTSRGPAPCEIMRTEAHVDESVANAPLIAPSPVSFVGDSVRTAKFAPAEHGFGGYHGAIAIDVFLRVENEEGRARFALEYTPAAPARFTRVVREELIDGSLYLYVQLEVTKPGRYVLAARVEEASGEKFAYVDFNDTLAAGLQEAKFCIWGKLVHDERADAPFVLRDIEGFLLRESYPDREMMVGVDGPYHTTKPYDVAQFSDVEWESEEKTRHVTEFSKDVREAEAEVRRQEEAAQGKP